MCDTRATTHMSPHGFYSRTASWGPEMPTRSGSGIVLRAGVVLLITSICLGVVRVPVQLWYLVYPTPHSVAEGTTKTNKDKSSTPMGMLYISALSVLPCYLMVDIHTHQRTPIVTHVVPIQPRHATKSSMSLCRTLVSLKTALTPCPMCCT